jgi:hypothetical protein
MVAIGPHTQSAEGCKASGGFPVSPQQFHTAFDFPQSKFLGADSTEPEVFYGIVFSGKAKKSASIHAHQRLRTTRVSTF